MEYTKTILTFNSCYDKRKAEEDLDEEYKSLLKENGVEVWESMVSL